MQALQTVLCSYLHRIGLERQEALLSSRYKLGLTLTRNCHNLTRIFRAPYEMDTSVLQELEVRCFSCYIGPLPLYSHLIYCVCCLIYSNLYRLNSKNFIFFFRLLFFLRPWESSDLACLNLKRGFSMSAESWKVVQRIWKKHSGVSIHTQPSLCLLGVTSLFYTSVLKQYYSMYY